MFDYPLWLVLLLYALVPASYYLQPPQAGRLPWWPWPLSALLVLLLAVGYLQLMGLLALLLLAGLCFLTRQENRLLSRLSLGLAMVLFLLMGMHLIPGFDNPLKVDGQLVKPGSVPFTMYINFDKGLAGVLLLLMVVLPRAAKPSAGSLKVFIVVAPVLSVALLELALISGMVVWNTRQLLGMGFWCLFFFNQILFVALAEEVFFRGVIQTALLNYLQPKLSSGAYWAIAITAVLFGAVHFAGGPGMVVAATLAGLGYGFVYHKTRRIEAAIAVHVLVNMLHLSFFSYPLLPQ